VILLFQLILKDSVVISKRPLTMVSGRTALLGVRTHCQRSTLILAARVLILAGSVSEPLLHAPGGGREAKRRPQLGSARRPATRRMIKRSTGRGLRNARFDVGRVGGEVGGDEELGVGG